MAKALELTWVGSLKQWRKRRTINGKQKTFYLGKGESKNDRMSYGRALAKWREIERGLNYAQRGEELRRAYDEWQKELVNRPGIDLDMYFPRHAEPLDPTKPLSSSMQRWVDGEARMGEDRFSRADLVPSRGQKTLWQCIDDYIEDQQRRYEHGLKFPNPSKDGFFI